jgi:hypothetical protein
MGTTLDDEDWSGVRATLALLLAAATIARPQTVEQIA